MSVILNVKPGEAIVLLGFAIWIVGQIWFTIRTFQCSWMWGVAILFIPMAGAAFLFGRWRYARTPFLVNLTGLLLMLLGAVMMSQAPSPGR